MSSRQPSPTCPLNTPSIAAESRHTCPLPAPTGVRPLRQRGAKQEADGSSTKGRRRRAGAATTRAAAEKGAWNTEARMKTEARTKTRIERKARARSPCTLYHRAYHYQRALRKGGVLVLVQCLTLEAAKRQRQQCDERQK
jgi:hypothetical protein